MGGFFKRGDVVTIDGKSQRWCIDGLREISVKGEPVMMADLSNEGGDKVTRDTERLTKVGG